MQICVILNKSYVINNSRDNFRRIIMQKEKIYLAGPDVFAPNAVELGNRLKWLCNKHGFEGLFPLDNEIDQDLPKKERASKIVEANMAMIKEADYIVANLSNFRGTIEHPYCDSGTAWECGYGVKLGKIVIGYTNNRNSIPEEILNHIHLTVKDITDVFDLIHKIEFRKIKISGEPSLFPNTFDPPFEDIKDSNAVEAFNYGAQVANGWKGSLCISDQRSQVEKYGAIDANGYIVEDFDYPVNIMIACTSHL